MKVYHLPPSSLAPLPYINAHLKKQSPQKPCHQPLTVKVSNMKVIQDSQLCPAVYLNLLHTCFEIEILPSVWKLGILRSDHSIIKKLKVVGFVSLVIWASFHMNNYIK